jgi:type IV secretion system protein VirB6
LFGIRVIMGPAPAARDLIGDVIKIGIVLTLATSWPAWRVVGYNLVLNGPNEIAHNIGIASGLPGADGTLAARLQNADDGLVAITMYGTGRLTGGVVGGSDLGDSFHGIALADQTGFGWGRIAFLTGIIAPFAVTRLGAGILLALAPLMAGLLLFGGTVGIFMGWLRGLAFVALASLALSIGAGAEVALIDPWIADVLAQRTANAFTPSAPTELTVLAMAFAFANLGIMALLARVAFYTHWAPQSLVQAWSGDRIGRASATPVAAGGVLMDGRSSESHTRAQTVADAMAVTMRREEAGGLLNLHRTGMAVDPSRSPMRVATSDMAAERQETLGNSFRRSRPRGSRAVENRDRRA